tara:strand:- start:929 stop:1114 length:186 start_codon:yes stop_codon:yes gene_type:complete
MKLDIKTLITLFAFAATVGGFYYSTEVRLTHLESHISGLQSETIDLKKQVQRLSRQIKRKN